MLVETNQQEFFPLGINQESQLFSRDVISQKHLVVPPSIMQCGIRFRGMLNIGALRRTLNDIVLRHAALRVTILPNACLPPLVSQKQLSGFARTGILQGGVYQQTILSRADVELREVDLTGYSGIERDDAIKARIHEENVTPFDYKEPPLLRAILLKVSSRDSILVVVVDHIVSDAWSMRVIRRELHLLYRFHCGVGPYPQGPDISFPEFVVWQHQACEGTYFDRSLRYWREQWAKFGSARIAIQDFPFATPESGPSDLVYPSRTVQFSAPESSSVRTVASQYGLSLFALFLAALATVVSRYVGNKPIALWGHFSNRSRREVLDSVGYFINTHLLGVDLSEDPSVEELFRQTRSVVLNSLSHQEMPLMHLWRNLKCAPRAMQPRLLLDCSIDRKPFKAVVHEIEMSPFILPNSTVRRSARFGIYVNDNGMCITIRAKFASTAVAGDGVAQFLADLRATVLSFEGDPKRKVSSLIGLKQSRPNREYSEADEFILLDSSLIPSVQGDDNVLIGRDVKSQA